MESAQISGKVFRFLSTMHPSLSKAERRRYAEYDPDKWYPWTRDIAGEFTDLVRRSPRDTSFARGFAYAAQKALPEDVKMSAGEMVRDLAKLPGAYADAGNSGFDVEMQGAGRALVRFGGMPGFTNACIVVLGELTQRLQAIGAKGVDVKHAEGCRLQGNEACCFEVRWSPDNDPADLGSPASARSAPNPQGGTTASSSPPPPSGPSAIEAAFAGARPVAPPSEPEAPRAEIRAEMPRPSVPVPPRPARPTPPPRPAAAESAGGAGSAQDLFEQLRVRLLDAEDKAARHVELEERVAELEHELASIGEELEASRSEARAVREAFEDLRRRIRDLVG